MSEKSRAPQRLHVKVAVVTGAGGGIGRAICLRLAEEGATLAVTDLTLERASAVASEIQAAGGQAGGDPAEVSALVAFLVSPEADLITGANYILDGGRTLGPMGAARK